MPAYSLALCFDAPMQSWGVRSRGSIRDTGREPSKSGVIGLLGAALGIARDNHEAIADLAQLRMGVRVDREGILERDFHTVQNVPTTTGTGHRTAVSHRYYLADALFLVVLQHQQPEKLNQILAALHDPIWPLFFGRRAFPPARPIVSSGRPGEHLTGLGLLEQPIEQVLATHPWLENRDEIRTAQRRQELRNPLRTVVDCTPDDQAAEIRPDLPLSFTHGDRRYTTRTVRTGHVPLTDRLINTEAATCI
ncbi:type I-E CRISPR-associated protein Cas5/CasD [Phytohabitans kaempferiae]|uniref:Type I-E CRISPR-associated protein Cas5/CasD n=1 Tax=Phytohabitans kaempferiae TaxID=1620943 RepID=A0ABV6M2Y0_9ACTN